MTPDPAAWPPLPLDAWEDTFGTLHMWTQIVGKTRLALAPLVNHWWNVVLYLSARGLTTGPMVSGSQTVEAEFDFVDHALVLRRGDGAVRALPLSARPVADFFRDYLALLQELGVSAKIRPVPVEVVTAIPFAEDRTHGSYDGDAARRCFRALSQADRLLKRFRGTFVGKCSPVHFFWGAFDLACTRFSGRRAPLHPGGAPNCPDWVMHEAYSHECYSAGWWPGGGVLREPAFYAYAYPEPKGLPEARIGPREAFYKREAGEFLLPYEAVRTAADPDALVLEFLRTTYEAAASLGRWDRTALERTGSGADR